MTRRTPTSCALRKSVRTRRCRVSCTYCVLPHASAVSRCASCRQGWGGVRPTRRGSEARGAGRGPRARARCIGAWSCVSRARMGRRAARLLAAVKVPVRVRRWCSRALTSARLLAQPSGPRLGAAARRSGTGCASTWRRTRRARGKPRGKTRAAQPPRAMAGTAHAQAAATGVCTSTIPRCGCSSARSSAEQTARFTTPSIPERHCARRSSDARSSNSPRSRWRCPKR